MGMEYIEPQGPKSPQKPVYTETLPPSAGAEKRPFFENPLAAIKDWFATGLEVAQHTHQVVKDRLDQMPPRDRIYHAAAAALAPFHPEISLGIETGLQATKTRETAQENLLAEIKRVFGKRKGE